MTLPLPWPEGPQWTPCMVVLGASEVIATTPWETLAGQSIWPSPYAPRKLPSLAHVTGQMSAPKPPYW
jgi:hypothetical protein